SRLKAASAAVMAPLVAIAMRDAGLLRNADDALDATHHAAGDTANDCARSAADRAGRLIANAGTLSRAARDALGAGAQGKCEDCQRCGSGQGDMLDCHDKMSVRMGRSAGFRALGGPNRTGASRLCSAWAPAVAATIA